MEGLYVDIRSLLDETTQERYHERIGGEYMGKSGVINQDFKGEDNTACRKKKVIQVNMSVEELCNPKGYYSIRGCSQKDRATLERMFGKTAEFRIEDIQSVSYGGIVLYENVASRNAA